MSRYFSWTHLTLITLLIAIIGLILTSSPLAKAKAAQSDFLQSLVALQGVTGGDFTVKLDNSQPTLIKLWASWCPLCLSELAQTEAWVIDPDFANANLVTLASPGQLGEMPLNEFKDWYAGLDYPDLPVQLDPTGDLVKSFGVQVYPSWVVLDANGKLQAVALAS